MEHRVCVLLLLTVAVLSQLDRAVELLKGFAGAQALGS